MVDIAEFGIQTQETPTLNRSQFKLGAKLGEGVTGVVHVAFLRDTHQRVVVKFAHQSINARAELRNDLTVTRYLEKKLVGGVARIIGVSPNMGNDPYLVKEFVDGTYYETTDGLGHISPSGEKPTSSVVAGRAEWCWRLLSDVLAPVHKVGVVIGDAKPADFILTNGEGGGVVVKCIEFGNAFTKDFEKGIIVSPNSEQIDCIRLFKIIIYDGFKLPSPPDKSVWWDSTGKHTADEWLEHIKAKNPHRALLKVCQDYMNMVKDPLGNVPTSFTNGENLAVALKPLFESLDVIKN